MTPDGDKRLFILIAEDNDDDYQELVAVFAASGLPSELRRAVDGVGVLEALRDGSDLPVLVILDLLMPRIDGKAALLEIRADPKLRHLPVMVLTSSQAAEDIGRSHLKGADFFARKPIEAPVLREIVHASRKGRGGLPPLT